MRLRLGILSFVPVLCPAKAKPRTMGHEDSTDWSLQCAPFVLLRW